MSKNSMPEITTMHDLVAWFDDDPDPVYEPTMPARMVDVPDERFWTDASEGNRYKLDKRGNPLPLDLNDHIANDYSATLAIGFSLGSMDDTDFNLNVFSN